jgi:hypothetical protein
MFVNVFARLASKLQAPVAVKRPEARAALFRTSGFLAARNRAT